MTSLLNVDDYERVAREHLEASIYDYIAGGSWDEITLERITPPTTNGDCVRVPWSMWSTEISV